MNRRELLKGGSLLGGMLGIFGVSKPKEVIEPVKVEKEIPLGEQKVAIGTEAKDSYTGNDCVCIGYNAGTSSVGYPVGMNQNK